VNGSRFVTAVIMAGLVLAAGTANAPAAGADVVAYLVNVTVRPGYGFTSADDAIHYGNALCDQIAHGRSYAEIIGSIKSDFGSFDEFQASYLIGQAVNELCPAVILSLRNSAANYRPEANPGSSTQDPL
jgi:hypothetical protein